MSPTAKITGNKYSFSASKRWYQVFAILVITLLLFLLLMVPKVAYLVAKPFTKNEGERQSLANKIKKTAAIGAFIVSALVVIAVSSMFVAWAPVIAIASVAVFAVGFYALGSVWGLWGKKNKAPVMGNPLDEETSISGELTDSP